MSQVKKLYLKPSESRLDAALRAELQEEFGGRMELAASKAGADAIMEVTLEEESGGKVAGAGRVIGLKNKVKATGRIYTTGTAVLLWQGEAGDRQALGMGDSVRRIASRIAKQVHQRWKDW